MKAWARVISVVFHPLLMATWVVLVLGWLNKYAFGAAPVNRVALVVFVNTFFFPAVSLLLMYKLDFIPDLFMRNKQDRTIPFFAVMVFYIWSFMVSRQMQMPVFVQLFILGATITAAMAFIANIFYKVSLHLAGIGGVVMLLLLAVFSGGMDVAHLLIGVVLAGGFVGSARLAENAHTPGELYYGFLIGMIGQMAGLFVFNQLSMA